MICAGALLLLASASLLFYSRFDDNMAGQRAQSLLEQVMEDGWEQSLFFVDESMQRYPSAGRTASILELSEEEQHPEDEQDAESWHGEALVYSVIGIMEIPVFNQKLPVLSGCTYALLNISVGRYAGHADEKPERLVIAGHNFRSHFGRISTLDLGDELLFTTQDGSTYRYIVIGMDSCHRDDKEAVREGDEWDITLLTCQKDRTMRTLVRFQEIE